MEPILSGDIPAPRKASGAAASGNRIFMFGGMKNNHEEIPEATDDLLLFEATSPNDLVCTENPPVSGLKPPARAYPLFQEYSSGKLFLYGGVDKDGKPLNDGWLLDIVAMEWQCVYNGHSDLVLPTGSVATLMRGRLVMLNANTGSPKLDVASSLDFVEVREQFNFLDKMKHEAVALLERLEHWADKQAHGMELAKNLDALGKNFDSLMKVMDALYQIKVKKVETDLLIDQLHECFHILARDKVQVRGGRGEGKGEGTAVLLFVWHPIHNPPRSMVELLNVAVI